MAGRIVAIAMILLVSVAGFGCSKSDTVTNSDSVKPPVPAPGVGKKMGVRTNVSMPAATK